MTCRERQERLEKERQEMEKQMERARQKKAEEDRRKEEVTRRVYCIVSIISQGGLEGMFIETVWCVGETEVEGARGREGQLACSAAGAEASPGTNRQAQRSACSQQEQCCHYRCKYVHSSVLTAGQGRVAAHQASASGSVSDHCCTSHCLTLL